METYKRPKGSHFVEKNLFPSAVPEMLKIHVLKCQAGFPGAYFFTTMFLGVLRAQAFIVVDVVGVVGGKGLSACCQDRNWEKICLQIHKMCHLRYTYFSAFLLYYQY